MTKPQEKYWNEIRLPALSGTVPLWPERYNLEDLEQIRTDVGEYDWESLYQQTPVSRQGRVFDCFHRDTHVVTQDRIPKQFKRVIFGMDFGFAHPGTLVVVGETGTGTLYAIHEESHRRLLFGEIDPSGKPGWLAIAASLRTKYHPFLIAADPSEPGYISALRQRLSEKPVVVGAKNDIAESIRRINVRLAAKPTPKLYVSDTCVKLIKGLETWCYVSTASGISETPASLGDDEIDALRYAVMGVT